MLNKKVVGLLMAGSLTVGSLTGYGFGNMGVVELQNQVTKLEKENKTLENKNNKLENTNTELEKNNKTLQDKVDQAKPWFEMKEEERKAEEERLAKEKAEKEEAERKAKEEAEAKAKAEQEAKEKQGYETGITYNQLARTPDEYMCKLCKFRGEVVQVLEDGDTVNMRLAVNGNYDNMLLLNVSQDKLSEGRILEGDYITIYGMSMGIQTYTSTMNKQVSIPWILVYEIDR